jgi:hypothetical protein
LFQHAPSYSERYEKWGEAHPVQQMALETGADFALGAAGPRVLRRLPGAFKTAGEVWEMAQEAGSIGDWAGGARHIERPRLKISKEPKYGSNDTDLIDTTTGKPVGYIQYSVRPRDKEVYISYWKIYPEYEGKYGPGQLLHFGRQLSKRFPEIENARFFRISGAGPRNKGYDEEVVMPLRRRTKQGEEAAKDPAMLSKAADMERGSRIRRERMDDPSTGFREHERQLDDIMAQLGHGEEEAGPTFAEEDRAFERTRAANRENWDRFSDRSNRLNLTREDDAKVFHIADERQIPENEALNVYLDAQQAIAGDYIIDRVQSDPVWQRARRVQNLMRDEGNSAGAQRMLEIMSNRRRQVEQDILDNALDDEPPELRNALRFWDVEDE